MLTAAVLVGLLAFVSARNNNMMGGQGMYGQGMYSNNMGNYMGGMRNMGNGMMNGMSQLFGLLSGHMGGNMPGNIGSNWGNQMGGNWGNQMGGNNGQMHGNMGGQMNGYNQMGGMRGQQGMMGGVMLLLLERLLSNNNGGRGNQGNQMNEEQMEAVEEMMKKKMMMEMTEMMMLHMDFKEKEAEFSQAMEAMCFMVNATYEAYRRNGTEVWKKTDDAEMERLGKQTENMSEEQKINFAINMMMTDEQKYSEVFLRFATWACMAGDEYAKSYMKMEKMEKGEGECEHK